MLKSFWFGLLAFVICSQAHSDPLETVLEWKLLEYAFPSPNERQAAINAGNLVPENGVPIDVDIAYAVNRKSIDRIFVTIPRFQTGIPFTLATFTPNGFMAQNGPMLQAYPNYNWHNSHGSNCDGITSAFRVTINECNQMWVIDSGVIGSQQMCPPQLLLFDLGSDTLIHRYRFDSSLYTPVASLFINPVSVVRDARRNACKESMIYVADVTNHGLVVYDYKNQRAWRVESQWMYPDPDFGNHTGAGESFVLMDGIFGLASDHENLYFHPLASINEFSVPLSVLNDANNFASGATAQENQFRKLGSRRSECAAEAIDSSGNIYCVTLNPISLISWNVRSVDYSTRTIYNIPVDANLLQFVSGMKVARNQAGQEELWLMSNRFQKIAAGTFNANEVNFRVLKRSLADLQRDLHNKLIFN